MSNRLLNAAWKAPVGSLAQKLVLVRLADAADLSGRCWPSHAAIAEDCGLNPRVVARAIEGLAALGLITARTQMNRTRAGGSRFDYTVHLDTVPRVPCDTVPRVPCDTVPRVPCDTVPRVHRQGTLSTSTGYSEYPASNREPSENPQRTSTPLPPRPEVEVENGQVNGHGPEPLDLPAIEAVWRVWPKKICELAAKREIGYALRRDGERVLAGTTAIVAADAARNAHVSPPGRYLPDPVRFFADSRYLDDPAQYAPRVAGPAASDPGEKRRRLQELRDLMASHPGNPETTCGSLEKKARLRPEFDALAREARELQRQIAVPAP